MTNTLHTSTEGTALVNGFAIELGCHIDGGVRTSEECDLDTVELASDLLGEYRDFTTTAPRVLEATAVFGRIGHHRVGDEDNAGEILHDLCEQAESDLNEATEDGYAWSWDGDFFLARVETFEAEVKRVESDAYLYVSSIDRDGRTAPDVSAERADYIAQAVFADAETGDTIAEVWAVWYGGQAPYVNLFAFGTEDADELFPNLQGVALSDGVECIGLGEERSAQVAHEAFLSFCQDYLDNSSMEHDFGCYGFGR